MTEIIEEIMTEYNRICDPAYSNSLRRILQKHLSDRENVEQCKAELICSRCNSTFEPYINNSRPLMDRDLEYFYISKESKNDTTK
jgi:hypothetical protein